MSELDNLGFDIQWPERRRFQMIGLGLNAVDWICVLPRYPEHNIKLQIEEMFKMGGGQIATASALCARYGLNVRYIGRIGDDDSGEFSREDLKKEPMDLSCVDVVPGAFSQFAVIMVDRPTGERTILWRRDPKMRYKDGELKREWIVEGQLLHVDGHDQPACIQAARWAREADMKVSLDVDKLQSGVEELLGLVDFAIPTIGFVQQFTGKKDWKEGLLIISEHTPGFVAVTRGKEGTAAVWRGNIIEIPGITVKTVDTTGAGDVFHGAFAYGLFQKDWSIGRCLRFANIAGALACTRYGARGGIPALTEVTQKMQHIYPTD